MKKLRIPFVWLGTMIVIAVCPIAVSAPPRAASTASLEQRLQRIETLAGSRALLDMNNQLQLLQSEVRQLRGQMEELVFELDQRRKTGPKSSASPLEEQEELPNYRVLFNDLDMRLNRLEHLGDQSMAVSEEQDQTSVAAVVAQPADLTSETEISLYKSAFDHLKEGRYPQAELDFKLYLERYPDGVYTDNVLYWLAETAYIVRNFAPARLQLEKLMEAFPNSAKMPDAWLKMGFIYYEEENYPKARECLELVRKNYSSSHAASLARQRLEQMTRDGR